MAIKTEEGKVSDSSSSSEGLEGLRAHIEIESPKLSEPGKSATEYQLSGEQLTGLGGLGIVEDQWDALINPLTRKEWQTVVDQAKQSLERLAGAEPEFVFLVNRAVGSLDVSLQRLCVGDMEGCKGNLQLAENSLKFMKQRLEEGINAPAGNLLFHSALVRAVNYFEEAFEYMESYLDRQDSVELFFAWDNLGDGIMSLVSASRMTESSEF